MTDQCPKCELAAANARIAELEALIRRALAWGLRDAEDDYGEMVELLDALRLAGERETEDGEG